MSPPNEYTLLLLLFSPLVAAILSLVGKFLPTGWSRMPPLLIWLGGTAAGLLASAGSIFNGEILLYSLGGYLEPYGIVLQLDGVTWLASVTDLLIAITVWAHARREGDLSSHFSFFFFLSLFALQAILYTRDIFNLFVWFEVLSLGSFLLIVYHRTAKAYSAAIRYLFMSSVSIIFYLIGVWILFRLYGSLDLPSLGAAIEAAALDGAAAPATAFAGALISAGILTRAAVFPFHSWLPEAHAAAPYPISALLSGFVIKAPLLALWRIYSYLPQIAYGELLVWLGGLCALGGVIAAMAQRDAKMLLGYHSVSQMGYIAAAFGMAGTAGRSAALLYIVAHALFKSLLFISIGRITEAEGSRDVYRLRGLGGKYPAYTALFAVAALSISGAPLFAGYTAKALVAGALYGHPAYLLLFAAGVGTAASFFKLARIFLPATRAGVKTGIERPNYSTPPRRRISSLTSGLSLSSALPLALGCLLLGLFPQSTEALVVEIASGIEIGGGGTAAGESSSWYGIFSLLKTGLSLSGGFLIALLLLSKRGRNFSSSIRARALGLAGSLRLMSAGFLLLMILALIPYYGG